MRTFGASAPFAGLVLCGVLALAPATARASEFGYTDGEQVWPVPAGVTAVNVVAVGAPGGGASGGEGAIVTADVLLPVGQRTLYVEVGGAGGTPDGGFNGGGAGGVSSQNPANDGSGGGGASDVRTCSIALGASCATAASPLDSRLVVAAGGGGTGPGWAGGPAGEAGGGDGGQPGAQSAGGEDGLNDCSTLPPATGGFGVGADGQIETPLSGGGGGGGGWYGGGGGAGAGVMGCGTDGGGGGGSSFVAGLPAPQVELDTSGTPQVTITAPVPLATGAPTISGGVVDGEVLTAQDASWINGPTVLARQWERCSGTANCSPIPGATGQTYTLTPPDVGHAMLVEESASNFYGTSAATGRIEPHVRRARRAAADSLVLGKARARAG